jgi:hypothetical protein
MSLVVPLSTIDYKDYSIILYSDNSIKKRFKNTGLMITLEESVSSRERDKAVIKFQRMINSHKGD